MKSLNCDLSLLKPDVARVSVLIAIYLDFETSLWMFSLQIPIESTISNIF